MTKLIADSGSTKTDWWLSLGSTHNYRFQSSGMNPSLMDDAKILHLLQTEVSIPLGEFLKSTIGENRLHIDAIDFYGAGCRPEQEERMAQLLKQTLGGDRITVASDLLGAAHALCGCQEGIVCILGTGSGSALYDGRRFVQQTPSLGYILGDEGSGASLGKHLLADVLKGIFPPHLCQAFQQTYTLDVAEVIQAVYREAAPNRYLSQFTHFLSKHRDEESVKAFLLREFTSFFERNIVHYHRPDLQVHFVGSIAAVFAQELSAAASATGFEVGRIERCPIDALLHQAGVQC